MDNQPFTLEEARDIAEDFEDLVDTDIVEKEGILLTVTHVVVSPFNKDEQEVYAINCIGGEVYAEEQMLEYGPQGYDVIIISQDLETDTNSRLFDITGIRTYIANNGIKYNFPA